jgi:uncharacterized protein (TIGR02996 family)
MSQPGKPSPTEAAFFRSMLDAPDDDATRLVYADWLEENGDAARGEFIRVQCERATLEGEAGQLHQQIARQEQIRHDREEVVFLRGIRAAVGGRRDPSRREPPYPA